MYFIALFLIIVMMAVSCRSAPPSQEADNPVEEVSGSEIPEDEPEIEAVEDATEEEIAEAEVIDEDIIEEEEPVLAEEIPPVEDTEPADMAEAFDEPEPPVAAVVPEPEPEPPPPPPPPPVAAPQPPRVIPPPEPPPPVVPPPVEPPQAAESPPPVVEEEPPAIVREPPPRRTPELPNPTPAIRGPQDEEMAFSRVVRATVGQLVVIPFRGTGWVYLGEAGARRGIVYDSRRIDPEGQSFIFRTEAAGEYALKFYRRDTIRDFILNDYVQVIVGAPAETTGTGWFSPSIDRGRVIAEPRWPSSLEEAQALRADIAPPRPDPAAATTEPVQPPEVPPATPPVLPSPPAAPPSVSNTVPAVQVPEVQPPAAQTPETPPVVSETPPPAMPTQMSPTQALRAEFPPDTAPETYLQKAKEEFDAGRVASAISILDLFYERYPMGSDEALWLYGQFYEANSPSRNILASLDYYRRLMQEYPQSGRYNDARRRIAYLQRYYINIH